MVFKPEDIQNRLEPEKLEEEFRTKAEQLKNSEYLKPLSGKDLKQPN
jgi:hypothetical protein